MSAQTARPVLSSPSWRIGFKGCANLRRLQIGDAETMERTEVELRAHVSDAGFDVIDSAHFRYSPEGEHGYTLAIPIGQSSVTFHTYPEDEWLTVDVVTCGDYEYCRAATHALARLLREYYGAHETELVEGPMLHSQ